MESQFLAPSPHPTGRTEGLSLPLYTDRPGKEFALQVDYNENADTGPCTLAQADRFGSSSQIYISSVLGVGHLPKANYATHRHPGIGLSYLEAARNLPRAVNRAAIICISFRVFV